eukprot:TRINITY_DN83171_c0_g1_i1.p1 TRINITY_DN83171_c0_g1~~TRINITY_DN83171_c0_g1_i1.p1  ORF type:complete len:505 (-),score=94.35 TRINITY_DN83171_c0_g1_i1:88-1602(-)
MAPASESKPELKVIEELRPFVQAGHTTVEWRIEQLELLRQAMIDEKDAMLKALEQDLGVDEHQALLFQIAAGFGEVDLCIDEVSKWAAPRKVPTPVVLQPASSYVQAQPKGVVLVLGAWNYPFNVTIGPACSAIAAGNATVIKPSELSPESAKVMQRIFSRLDQRAVRLFLGGPDVSSSLSSRAFDHIVYTGGPRVAKMILASAAEHLTPVTLELGGKSPVLLCEGINLNEACKRIATFKFVNKGQTCIAPDYILVERSIRDEVANLLTEAVKSSFGAEPHAADHYSRLVNPQAAERIRKTLKEDHGGKVLLGGHEMPAASAEIKKADRFVAPTIVLDPKQGSCMLENEIFGPILPVVTVDSVQEAISYVNARPKPLALYVFAPKEVAERVVKKTSSGAVVVNDTMLHKGNPHLPFGGIGNSGMGRLHGHHGFVELSNERAVMTRPLWPPSPIRMPIHPLVAKAAYEYATRRPGLFFKKHMIKVLIVLGLLLSFLARRRHRLTR